MKYLKPILGFLVSVVIVTAALSWLMPVKQTVERSVLISAPSTVVYERLSKLQYFNQFSIWSRTDSSAVYTFRGTDGTIGASCAWTGNPDLSGEGKIEITSLDPGKSVTQAIQFSRPEHGKAVSVFTLSENNGLTTVKWRFDLATPRPWNIFNLFSSLDKQMGSDFETSLNSLRDMIQSIPGLAPVKTYNVQELNLPATTYLAVRQQIRKDDIMSFFAQHLPLIKQELIKASLPIGIPAGITYSWDPGSAVTDLAAAFPVPSGTKNSNPIMQVIELPASKAVQVTYFGNYGKITDAYASLEKYIANKHLNRVNPSLEQYTRGPLNEPDSSKWETSLLIRVE